MEFLAETVRSWKSEVVHSISTAGGTFEVTADKYLRGSAFSHRWHRGDRWADTMGFMLLWGGRILGPFFPLKAMAIMLIPMLGMAAFGFAYKVKYLFLSVDGGSVAVLKSKERFELEAAQRAIESAKRAYESKERNA